jgi:hypothetical protein
MHQILDYGYWSDYGCGIRPLAMSFWSLIAGIFMSVIVTWWIAVRIPPHQMKLVILSCGAIALFVLPLIVIIPALARTTTMIFIEGNDIVRTGCWRGEAYDERSPLSDVTSRYFEINGRAQIFELHLQWPHQKGSVRINLVVNPNLATLATIAPKAMRDYVNSLQTKGREIPAPLRALANITSHH